MHFKLWKAREQVLSALKAVVIAYECTLENLWLLLASNHWVLFGFVFFSLTFSINLFVHFFSLHFRFAWQQV